MVCKVLSFIYNYNFQDLFRLLYTEQIFNFEVNCKLSNDITINALLNWCSHLATVTVLTPR